MMKALFILSVLMFSPAYAQDLDDICSNVVRHIPNDDVAYKPGVDVHGKPVVSADLNPSTIPVPDIIRIPLTVDALQFLDGVDTAGLLGEAQIAEIEIHNDGRVMMNGKDISTPIHAHCQEQAETQE